MTTYSFDPVAHIYDETRGYPEPVAHQIALAIDNAAEGTPQTHYLEIGVGTGRIALPLAALGRVSTGVDISERMLARFEQKLSSTGWQKQLNQPWSSQPDEDPTSSIDVRRFTQVSPSGSVRLVVSDIKQLPFSANSCDVVVAVHIFHLVSDWQPAMREVLRVLRPGGLLLRCADHDGASQAPDINKRWREIIRELGSTTERQVVSSHSIIDQWLQTRGFQPEAEQCVLTWERKVRPREMLDYIAQRSWSGSWVVPEVVFVESIKRLRAWADEAYAGDLDTEITKERSFIISKTRV